MFVIYCLIKNQVFDNQQLIINVFCGYAIKIFLCVSVGNKDGYGDELRLQVILSKVVQRKKWQGTLYYKVTYLA
jgi:hypothetical protein